MSEPFQQPEPPERRADAAHPCRDRSVTSQLGVGELSPSLQPAPAGLAGAILERLEVLDDLVFESIAGKPGAIEQLRLVWPATLKELGPELLEESRSQYLRHAMNVWKDCIASEEIRNPALAIAAIDVINILLGVSNARVSVRNAKLAELGSMPTAAAVGMEPRTPWKSLNWNWHPAYVVGAASRSRNWANK